MGLAKEKEKESKEPISRLIPKRGSLVTLKKPINGATQFAIVVSNDIQNDSSDYILVVPLQRRASRLKAPFAVDFGREEGFRELHTARCDWVQRIEIKELSVIERASVSELLVEKIDKALAISLGIGFS